MEAGKPNCCQNVEQKLVLMLLIKIVIVWGLSFLNQCLIDKTQYQCIRLDDCMWTACIRINCGTCLKLRFLKDSLIPAPPPFSYSLLFLGLSLYYLASAHTWICSMLSDSLWERYRKIYIFNKYHRWFLCKPKFKDL